MEKKKFINIVYLDDDTKEYNYDLKVIIYEDDAITHRTADLQKRRNVRICSTEADESTIKRTYERFGYSYNPNLRW